MNIIVFGLFTFSTPFIVGQQAELTLLQEIVSYSEKANNAHDDNPTTTLFNFVAQMQSKTGYRTIERLLAEGADLTATNASGETPLLIAASSGTVNGVTQMLMFPADINAQDHLGRTALHWTLSPEINPQWYLDRHVTPGRYMLATVLLNAGADPTIKDENGRTAEDYLASLCSKKEEQDNLLDEDYKISTSDTIRSLMQRSEALSEDERSM